MDSPGNKLLVTEQCPRTLAWSWIAGEGRAPLIFFKGVPHSGKVKGHVEFQGFGLIERAEFVSQLDPKTQKAFSNVRYDFAVMSSVAEGEDVDWDWINARRDSSLSLDECLACAPAAWQWWVANGTASLPRVRRMLSPTANSRR